MGIQVTRFGRTRTGFEPRIVSEEHGALAAEGTSTVIVFDYADQRLHPVPEAVRQAIRGNPRVHLWILTRIQSL